MCFLHGHQKHARCRRTYLTRGSVQLGNFFQKVIIIISVQLGNYLSTNIICTSLTLGGGPRRAQESTEKPTSWLKYLSRAPQRNWLLLAAWQGPCHRVLRNFVLASWKVLEHI